MKSSEASHIGNLTNFDQMISVIKGFGEVYNPSNPVIKTPALEAKSRTSHDVITDLNTKASAYRVAIERRLVIYEPFPRKITQIYNLLKSSGTSTVMHEEVGIIIRKLKGARSGKKLPAHASGEEIQGPKQISVSQLGYNDQLDSKHSVNPVLFL